MNAESRDWWLGRVRSVVTAVMIALLLVVGSSAARASAEPATPTPSDPCPGQLARAKAVQGAIDAHNSAPHTFIIPDQQAQADAYNAEARRLNADKDAAVGALSSCALAIRDLTAGARIPDPQPRTIDKIKAAKDGLPPGFTAPAPPPTTTRDAVRVVPDMRPLYKALREVAPQRQTELGNVALQGKTWPQAGDPDPVYPSGSGRTIGTWVNGNPAVSPDHIVPLARLLYIPGFVDLSPEYMYMVAHAPLNLQWLSRSGNSSKGSAQAAAVLGADPAWQAAQQKLEDETLAKLEHLIATLKSSMGPS